MAGNIALNGVAVYGGGNLPKPATAVIAYTGQSTFSRDFSPAFITVAANDGIANVNTVERRVENLRNAGVEVEYHRFKAPGMDLDWAQAQMPKDGWTLQLIFGKNIRLNKTIE